MIEIQKYKSSIDAFILEVVQSIKNNGSVSMVLCEAVEYVMMSGGKRLRSSLLMFIADALDVNYNDAMLCASALEMIHNYTLVHDDLPAMDDDDFRRGLLTCHKKFGDGIAILVGSALYNLGLQLLVDGLRNKPDKLIAVMQVLLKTSGLSGVLSGQAEDILMAEQKLSTLQDDEMIDIIDMYYLKTGKLFEAAFIIPAILADCDLETQTTLARCGSILGVLYQLIDDIEDGDGVKEGEALIQELMQKFVECIDNLHNERLEALKIFVQELQVMF